MKHVYAAHLGHDVVVGGRRRPVAIGPHFRAGAYLLHGLPPAPSATGYAAKAQPALRQMYLNDRYGCCVVAGGYHITGVETGNATGNPYIAPDDVIVSDYSTIGGFDPKNPQATDNGCDEATALNYWTQHGLANGTKLLGWLAVNAASQPETRAALWLFENLMFGIEIPDAGLNPLPTPGSIWNLSGTPNPENGHCVAGVDFDSVGVQVATWGMVVTIKWEDVARLAVPSAGGMLYTVLSPDQLGKAITKAPNGVAWLDLVADFNSMGGHVASPPSAPPPADPNAPVTMEQAMAWATHGVECGGIIQLRGGAAALARRGIANNWPKRS